MRTALYQGMHTELPAHLCTGRQIERARAIWWTVYMLDRELSSLMGLPIQIADENITTMLPPAQTDEQATAFRLHIKLCRIMAQVVRSTSSVAIEVTDSDTTQLYTVQMDSSTGDS
jgi:proline utilization trans-activator